MKKKSTFNVLIFCLILATTSQGQENSDHKKNNSDDLFPRLAPETSVANVLGDYRIQTIAAGQVPNRITRSIEQDSQGHLWIASWDGVFKYNGSTFTHITKGVSSARFFDVLEDHDGHFWFASVGSGVYFYDGLTFKNYTTDDGLASNRVTLIYQSGDGKIWLGTEGGLSVFDGQSFRSYTTDDGLPSNRVNAVIERDNGRFWVGTVAETVGFDPVLSTFSMVTNKQGRPFTNTRMFHKDSQGRLWLAGASGLWRLDKAGFLQFSEQFTAYISEQKQGHLLTSSGSSSANDWELLLYANATTALSAVKPQLLVTQNGMLFGMAKDDRGHVWYGAMNGIYRFDGQQVFHYVNN